MALGNNREQLCLDTLVIGNFCESPAPLKQISPRRFPTPGTTPATRPNQETAPSHSAHIKIATPSQLFLFHRTFPEVPHVSLMLLTPHSP